MPDEEKKKIIVDDDWKAEAKQEKERLAKEETVAGKPLPEPSFAELVNIVVMQAMAALGVFAGPDGKPLPPQPEVAKHFIDMLQVLEEKTRNNLTAEEKTLLDQVLYETRMAFVQAVSGAAPPPPGTGPGPATPPVT